MERELVRAGSDWHRQITELQQLLEAIRPELVSAEAELAERMAAISAFEFQVRTRLEALIRRLEKLEVEVAGYRAELRRMQQDWLLELDPALGEEDSMANWDFSSEGAASSSEYRYREPAAPAPPPELSIEDAAALKQLYRKLARRFHPDFALDEADRLQRTQMMMAVNAAYAAGDLARLEALERQPDVAPARTYSDQELAEALLAELAHCRQRLNEIRQELANLERHQSAKLMQRAARAEKEGRDLLDELAAELRDRTAELMIQRDVLLNQIEAFERGEPDFSADALADLVYDLGLEQALDEDDSAAVSAWRDRRYGHLDFEDAEEDDSWVDALRKERKRKR